MAASLHPALSRMDSLVSARTLPTTSRATAGLDVLAGRFVEITGGATTAALSVTASLVHAAQRQGNFAAWIGEEDAVFFPPDFATAGIDLRFLPVVRLHGAAQAWRAADTLLRSGAFAVVVVDCRNAPMPSLSIQTRLAGLAQKHNSVLVALRREGRGEAPRSSLVSLRADTSKHRAAHDCFACEVHIVKDKRHAPGWTYEEWRRGTDGLC